MTAVLFATEYDTANIVVNILSNTPTEHYLFPLIVKYRPSNRIEFVLQTQKCPESTRVRPVFICDARQLPLSRYLASDSPLPANAISASINAHATREIYDDLFENREENTDDLKCLIHFNRPSILRYLNTTFLAPTSPSWFLSTYGTNEGTLLLTMSYYLFEKQYSTIQTTRDYTKCYTSDPGRALFTYINMKDFMAALGKSPFRQHIDRFARYAKSRNARDGRELQYVDVRINEFREESRLPADSCVYYVYLAYRTALSREKILRYCEYAEYSDTVDEEQQCTLEENFLGRSLDNELISVMDTYFSVTGYFGTYIQVYRVNLPRENNYRGYSWNTSAASTIGYSSNMINLANAIRKLNQTCDSLFSPLQTTIGGFLNLCSSDRNLPTSTTFPVCRRNYLLNDTKREIGPMPVFRVEMPEKKHIFCGISSEDWNRRLLPRDLVKNLPSDYISDESTTDAIWLHEDIVAADDIGEQLYRTRHEIFNERLPVFNFIGDVDLKLREDIHEISKKDFFDLCRALRKTLIEAWKHLFPSIKPDSHPIFFFKSACQSSGPILTDDMGYDLEPKFCSCRKKLGMRIIIPFPTGTVALGSMTLRRLAKILDHTLTLDRDLVRKLNNISHPGECFDTGIYHNGRSVRMPFMYKIDEDGPLLYGRLNPIFIIPKYYHNNPVEFILKQLCPENLTHHGNATATTIVEAVINIEDKACMNTDGNFLQSKSESTSQRVKPPLGPLLRTHLARDGSADSVHLITDAETVNDLDNDIDDDHAQDIQAFARRVAWPLILEHTKKHYKSEIQEQLEAANIFNTVGRNCISVKRVSYGRIKDFRCLTREHRTPQETVQVFLDIRSDYRNNIWATLWSRCFTRKCNSNAKQTHISVKIPTPSQY
uniref:Helicase-primase primase subunit n=1 Tax=Mastomys natalensis cytomegalovirus 1 TaxID=2973541 RepID=A0A9Y1N8F7_9BETA|nr:helicase-primase primase subunit [Mastomys natalensis cytomegalovirus 1]WEG68927.1 helicase-primase primase subunit [Mastomys natalensis cytomegalovirus 1]WEG71155.1 helicase-primase primase subunit [Mastomys natalensis cytomegalovirus 1]